MKKLEDTGLLVARILMPILFIVAGYGKMGDAYAGTQQYMQSMGVPGFLLPLTILLEFGGGLAILFGFLDPYRGAVHCRFHHPDRAAVPH